MHGGVIATIMDALCGVCASTAATYCLDNGKNIVTANLNISYKRLISNMCDFD